MATVTVRLYGRLGNQLFQIATAYAYALKHGHSFALPTHSINHNIWDVYYRNLDRTDLHDKYGVTFLNTLLIRDNKFTIRENKHDFNNLANPNVRKDSIIELDGYFQTELYFIDYYDQVKEFLLYILDIKNTPKKDSCMIHVRRGDYLEYADKHPSVSYGYVKNAIELMQDKFEHFEFYSDDINWCRENMIFDNVDIKYIDTSSDALGDFQQMLLCKGHIISNSTYSWWAAWLHEKSHEDVIAPSIWFGTGNKHLSTVDVVPKLWKQI